MSELDPVLVMTTIAKARPLFHSEADFQHAFAWELHRLASAWEVRLEVPVRTQLTCLHLDLLARSGSSEIAIELKYKTRALTLDLDGEEFSLSSHAAQDLGRYDFFKDLSRVEGFAQSGPNRCGYVIFLTNDSAYWKPPASLDHGYARFAINDGCNVAGELCWGERASEGTRRGRRDNITIGGNYHLKWAPYSSLPVGSYGEFRYLCIRAGAA